MTWNNISMIEKMVIVELNGKMLGTKWCVSVGITDVRAKYDAKF